MESIIVAAFAALASILGSYMANRKSSALVEYRLLELEKKVSGLASDAKDIAELHNRIDVLEERIKVANNRIKDLESGSAN